MKILFHSYAFEPGWTYQEMLLPKACMDAGHEVLCVASYIGVDETGKMGKLSTEEDPAYLHRLPALFSSVIPLSYRLRKLQGFYEVLDCFSPDVIFVHALQTLNLADIEKYKEMHPSVRVYFNTHTDYYTSGTNVISKYILHKFLYRQWIKRYQHIADNIFYISMNCAMFLWNEYKIPKEKTEFMPMGWNVSSEEQIINSRRAVLQELGLPENSIIFMQAGKMDENKKILESIEKFRKTTDSNYVYIIIGSIAEHLRTKVLRLIDEDRRIFYLGWKSGSDLFHYLEAADFYVQPGKVSVILQHAICCSCAIIARHFIDYVPFIDKNGWLIQSMDEFDEIYSYISKNKLLIPEMKKKSYSIANEFLNLNNLIKKIK